MSKSTIFSTRAGYFYQDKIAVYLFLRHFHQRDLAEFYLDYPLPYDQKSLDVRLITKKRQEKVYEIKSGNTFKNSEEEVLDSILDLHEYYQKNEGVKTYLIVSHGFKPAISNLWDSLLTLKSYKILNSDKSKKMASDLLNKLNKQKKIFNNIKEVHTFIKTLNLDDPFSDEKTGDSENEPYIEDFIIREIDKILGYFKSDSRETEYPTKIIYYDYIYQCCLGSGNDKNLLPIFTDTLIEHMTMRRLFSKHYERPFDLEQKKSEVRSEVETNFYKWWIPELIIKSEQSPIKGL